MIPPLDTDLRASARGWTRGELKAATAQEELLEIARSEGLDFATALLHEQIATVPKNADFLSRAAEMRDRLSIPADLIGIVPGAFYREHPHTGADGARILRIARELGVEAELIPTGSLGTLRENAEAILGWLSRHRGKRVVLVSLSKGSADVKQALAESEEAFAGVATWISLSGLIRGTPLITWLRRRPLRWWSVRFILWWRRLSANALRELASDSGASLAPWPTLRASLSVVHVHGFPLAQHLSHAWAPRGYARLAPLGPNDGGGVLLADLLHLPGIVCPVWGADHYLDPKWGKDSLLRGIIAAAAEPRQAIRSANAPMSAPAIKSSA